MDISLAWTTACWWLVVALSPFVYSGTAYVSQLTPS